jgi:hypothetical protein
VRRLAEAARRLAPLLMWGALPVGLTAFTFAKPARGVHFAGDFHYAFWPAGQRVLHGLSPYVDPSSPAVAHAVAFVYPALAALLIAPFALVPHATADVVFAALNLAAALLTLRVLEVRDWRLYGLVLLCPAVYAGWTLANISLLLGLGIAVCWRYRDRPLVVGALAAVLISAKVFLWPLAFWLLATRRYAALAYAVAGTLALNAIAWSVVGFHELSRYSALLHALGVAEERRGYSVIALARRAGIEKSAAYAIAIALALALAALCVTLGRRGRDVQALALAIAVCLLATPIVQLHYFALLIPALALVRPRLSMMWSLPLLMWACASASPAQWQIATALTLAGAIVAIALRSREGGRLKVSKGAIAAARLDLRLVPPSDSSVVAGTGGR